MIIDGYYITVKEFMFYKVNKPPLWKRLFWPIWPTMEVLKYKTAKKVDDHKIRLYIEILFMHNHLADTEKLTIAYNIFGIMGRDIMPYLKAIERRIIKYILTTNQARVIN